MSKFEDAIAVVLSNEGGQFVPDDQGRGPSKWGVTLKTAQAFHPDWIAQDIQNLTYLGAQEFYRDAFWETYRIGLIENQELATKVFDLCINVGPRVILWLQDVVGVKMDGVLGRRTATAVNSRDQEAVLAVVKAKASAYYHQIVLNDPGKVGLLTGWLQRLAS